MLHYLSETRDVEDLFKNIRTAAVIEFAPTKYRPEDVISLCSHYGYKGSHCKKGSVSYKKYGEFAIKIIGKVPPNERIVGTFDPTEVVVNHKDKFLKNCKETELKRNGVLV